MFDNKSIDKSNTNWQFNLETQYQKLNKISISQTYCWICLFYDNFKFYNCGSKKPSLLSYSEFIDRETAKYTLTVFVVVPRDFSLREYSTLQNTSGQYVYLNHAFDFKLL